MKRTAILLILTGVFTVILLFKGVSQSKLLVRNAGFSYDAEKSSLVIRDHRSGSAYSVQLDEKVTVDFSSSSSEGLRLTGRYAVDPLKDKYNPVQITVRADSSTVNLTLEMTDLYRMYEPVSLEVETPGDGEQYFVIPYAEGMLIPAVEKFPFNEFYLCGYKATMPFVGISDLQQGLMVISENPWDTSVKFNPSHSTQNHHMQIKLWPSKESFDEPRTLVFAPVAEGGYVAMAKIYRHYRNTREPVLTLDMKSKTNPNVKKLVGACDFWLLEDLGDESFIDRLMRAGVDKAIFSFYESWYVHDHEQNPELIQYAADKGFLAGRYDIDTDVWNPGEIPSHLAHIRTDAYPKDVVVKASGEMQKNWTRYLNGRPVDGYTVCSSAFWKYGAPRIGSDLIRNNYNTRFFDTILSLALLECYSAKHPLTRYEDMINKKAYLESVGNRFGLIMGTEDIRDYAVNQVHYNEGVLTIVASQDAAYSWLEPVSELGEEYELYNMDATRRIPLFQLVFHDSVASTWYTGDSVSKVPACWQKKDLFTVLYGCMPLIMPKNRDYWDENEAQFLSSIHLAGALYECVGKERMVTHQFISRDKLIQRTLFSNGWEVIGNFSDQNICHESYTIPPNGFYATDGKYEIYRVQQDGALLDVVHLKDRLFINPYGEEVTVGDTTTDGIIHVSGK
jgi:hypothetical protein